MKQSRKSLECLLPPGSWYERFSSKDLTLLVSLFVILNLASIKLYVVHYGPIGPRLGLVFWIKDFHLILYFVHVVSKHVPTLISSRLGLVVT